MENRPTKARKRADEAAGRPAVTFLPEPAAPVGDAPAAFRHLLDHLNARRFADLGHLFAPGFVDHDRWPGQRPGADGFRAALAEFLEAFPDGRFEAEEVLAVGDRAAYTLVFAGTHQGPAMGLAPTGRAVRVRGTGMVRAADGRITASWGGLDVASLLDQLRAGPWNREPGPEVVPAYDLL